MGFCVLGRSACAQLRGHLRCLAAALHRCRRCRCAAARLLPGVCSSCSCAMGAQASSDRGSTRSIVAMQDAAPSASAATQGWPPAPAVFWDPSHYVRRFVYMNNQLVTRTAALRALYSQNPVVRADRLQRFRTVRHTGANEALAAAALDVSGETEDVIR